jgi:pyridoxine 5-phosphate synthase
MVAYPTPTRLSVNLNKIALLRNSRETGVPSVVDFAGIALGAGADGITVHPRPGGRHIRASDVVALAEVVARFGGREFNVEGRPSQAFLELVEQVRPHQCTLVPDTPDQATSDRGWDFAADRDDLAPIVSRIARTGCRVILFADPDPRNLEHAKATGADGIEIYTGAFAAAARAGDYRAALGDVATTAMRAAQLGLVVNGGHDLNRRNLRPLLNMCSFAGLSIGHELIADALLEGFSPAVASYRRCIRATSAAWRLSA